MTDGFSVDLGALENAVSGIDDTLTELDKTSVDSLDGDASDYGHDHLAGTVKDFCDRWQVGVEYLAADGREVVQRLKQCVRDYLAVDRTAKGRMDGIFASTAEPDPAAH